MKLSSSQLLSTEIPSGAEIIFWLCVRPGTGKTTLASSWFPQTQTSETRRKKYGTTLRLLLKRPGTALSKNTPSSLNQPNLRSNLLAGLTMVTPVLRVLIIVRLELTRVLDAPSPTRTTKLACLLEFKSPEQTLRLCPVSGNTKWVLLQA